MEWSKFSDARLVQAQRIIDRAGPGAMYWMAEYESSAKAGLSVIYQELGLRMTPTASNY